MIHLPHHSKLEWIGIASMLSTGASVACNILPNDKYLADYPRAQKLYRTVINFTAAAAINIRHCLPSLDVPAPLIGICKTKPIDTGGGKAE